MYHRPRMCRTCLQMSRGDFKFVSLDSTDKLWESNSPNLKDQLIYIVPEMKLENKEDYLCTSCFIALRTAYEFKRMCQATEQKFQSYNYKYRRPFGVGPGSPQFHVTLNENSTSSSVPNYRCQNLNYLQTDTSIDITEHHLYDASKILPRKQLAYLNNVTQKLPEIDVEVIMGQKNNVPREVFQDKKKGDRKEDKKENKLESKENRSEKKELKTEKTENKTEKKENALQRKETAPIKKDAAPEKALEKKATLPEMKEVAPQKKEIKPEKKDTAPEKKETAPGKKENVSEQKENVTESNESTTEKKEDEVEKKENQIERKEDNRSDNKEDNVEKLQNVVEVDVENVTPKEVKVDSKPSNTITLPNLPGIEIVPKRLDSSVALRKKYNIGSQISILKTAKTTSSVDTIIQTACEEITYLKSNNILPDALNCCVRIEDLTSEVTKKNTAESYTLNELKDIADSYYVGCTEDILTCNSCSRSFSTNYWLKIHEEEHNKDGQPEQQFHCVHCNTNFEDAVKLEEHSKTHSVEIIAHDEIVEATKPPASDVEIATIAHTDSSDKDNKVTVPLLDNDQISITPILNEKKLYKTDTNESLTNICEGANSTPTEIPSVSNTDENADLTCKDVEIPPLPDTNKDTPQISEDIQSSPPKIIQLVSDTTNEDQSLPSVKTLYDTKEDQSSPIKTIPLSDTNEVSSTPSTTAIPLCDANESQDQVCTDISSPPTSVPPLSVHVEEPKTADAIVKKDTEEKPVTVPSSFSEQLTSSIMKVITDSENNANSTSTKLIADTSSNIKPIKTDKLDTSGNVKQTRKVRRRCLVTLLKKKSYIKLKYMRCFVCHKLFRNKISLEQHCKFIHIPHASSSPFYYWSSVIAQRKEKRSMDISIEDKNTVDKKPDTSCILPSVTPMRTAKANRKITHVCNICDKRVSEARFLDLHMFVHIPTYASMDPNIPHTKNGEVFRCYLCDKTFPKERYLKLHNLQVHLTKTSICKVCNREFKSDFWYSQHKCVLPIVPVPAPAPVPEPEPQPQPEPDQPVVKEGDNQFECTECDRKFARLRFMKSHRHRMHKNFIQEPLNDINSSKQSGKGADEIESENDQSVYDSDIESELPNLGKNVVSSQFAQKGGNQPTKDSAHLTNSFSEMTTRRRSQSRGAPKIQCDFCGEYIEETAYDKHIFEHNKVRLDKSISKRKSLDSSFEDSPAKKQALFKCPICYKPFKRKHNLSSHISRHEGAEDFEQILLNSSDNISAVNETIGELDGYLSEGEALHNEPEVDEIMYGQISIIDGAEIYQCCGRPFKLKAHFFRHFKIKHPNCVFKPTCVDNKDIDDDTESKELDVLNTTAAQEERKINDHVPPFTESCKVEDRDEKPKPEVLQVTSKQMEEEGDTVIQSEDSTNKISEINTELSESVRKKRRRRFKRKALFMQPSNKKHSNLICRSNDKDELPLRHRARSASVPLTTNNANKRKRSLEFESVTDQTSNKKITKKSFSGAEKTNLKNDTVDESGDLSATALHLRQLDLLPVLNKNTAGRYECHICEKRFKQKCQLRDHFNVHTGDKPYKCDFCNPARGFTQTSSLYVHFRRVHSVVMKNSNWEVYSKNGACRICSDIFTKHSHMFKHMKDYYIENQFECHVCNKHFSMTCHYKVHNIDPQEMAHILPEGNLAADDDDDDDETKSECDGEITTVQPDTTEENVGSDSDSSIIADKLSGTDDNINIYAEPLRCTKCKKTFINKQQLKFHKKSLAHIQQIQVKRRKVNISPSDEIETSSRTDTDAIEDMENSVKAIIKKIRIFKKHKCNICGVSFIKRMHLKKHKRKHKIRKCDQIEIAATTQTPESNLNLPETHSHSGIEDVPDVATCSTSTTTPTQECNLYLSESDTEMEDVPDNAYTDDIVDEDDEFIEIEIEDDAVPLVDPKPTNPDVEEQQLIDALSSETSIDGQPSKNEPCITTDDAAKALPDKELAENVIVNVASSFEPNENPKLDEPEAFDIILKFAESTSDLNKQFLLKQANTNKAISLELPECSSNSNIRLGEVQTPHSAVQEVPETDLLVTYIKPNSLNTSHDISFTASKQVSSSEPSKSCDGSIKTITEPSTCSEITLVGSSYDSTSFNYVTSSEDESKIILSSSVLEADRLCKNVEFRDNYLHSVDNERLCSNFNDKLASVTFTAADNFEKPKEDFLNDGVSLVCAQSPELQVRSTGATVTSLHSYDNREAVVVSKDRYVIQSITKNRNSLEIPEMISTNCVSQTQSLVSDHTKCLDLDK